MPAAPGICPAPRDQSDNPPAAGTNPVTNRPPAAIQQRLFPPPRPLVERLGNAFFRAIPRAPGVYFFHDDCRRLLYLGKAVNLRQRIGSYRFVQSGRHPARTVRLVHATAHIHWDVCESAQNAEQREAELLRVLHPPFNVAGTWPGEPFFVHLPNRADPARARLRTVPGDAAVSFGPFARKWVPAVLALIRLSHFASGPGADLGNLPAGLGSRRTHADLDVNVNLLFVQAWRVCRASPAEAAVSFLRSALEPLGARCPFEQQLIAADLELVSRFLEAWTVIRMAGTE